MTFQLHFRTFPHISSYKGRSSNQVVRATVQHHLPDHFSVSLQTGLYGILVRQSKVIAIYTAIAAQVFYIWFSGAFCNCLLIK